MFGEVDGIYWVVDFFDQRKDNFYIYCWLETAVKSAVWIFHIKQKKNEPIIYGSED